MRPDTTPLGITENRNEFIMQQQHQQLQQQSQLQSELFLNTSVDMMAPHQPQQQQLQQHLSILLDELEALKKINTELNKTNVMLMEELTTLKKKSSIATTSNAPRKMARKNNNSTNANNNISNFNNNINNNALCNSNMDVTTDPSCSNSINNNNINNSIPSNYNINQQKKNMQATGIDVQTLKRKIKNSKCSKFFLKQNNSSAPVKIIKVKPVKIEDPNEILKVGNTLSSGKISFHEYKWKSEKDKCFLIRGLTGATADDIPTIKQDLIDAGLPDSIAVFPLITGYMRANPQARHNALFKLIIPPDFDSNILLNIKYLDHVAITFESFKSKSTVQCKNCQRLGHSGGGCGHEHWCVKCGENHMRVICPRTTNKSIKLKCCNCGGERTANNLSACKYFANYINVVNKNKTNSNSTINNAQKATSAHSSSNRSQNLYSNTSLPNPSNGSMSYAKIVGNSTESSNSSIINDVIFGKKMDMMMNILLKHDNSFNKILNG